MNYLDLLAGTAVNADSGVVYGGGSLDIRVFAKRIGDTATDHYLMATRGNGIGWGFGFYANGVTRRLEFVRQDGTGFQRATSANPSVFDSFTWMRYRATYDVSTGGVVFYYGEACYGSDWTVCGSGSIRAGAITPSDSLRAGNNIAGLGQSERYLAWGQLAQSINGTPVARFDAAQYPVGAGSGAIAVGIYGNTWTLSASASIKSEPGPCDIARRALRSPRYGLTRLARR